MPMLRIQWEYEEVTKVQTAEDLRTHLVRFARRRDFELCGVLAGFGHLAAEPQFTGVHNVPPGYLDTYGNVAAAKRDPVMQHCKYNSVPIIWNQETYTSVDAGDVWEEQARFGYKTGIAVGLRLPRRRRLIVGIDRDRALPANPRALSRLVAELQLFVSCAADVAMNVLAPQADVVVGCLAPREVECLSWTMEGKTAWEVGAIVGLAEATVVSYLRSAMRKLDCSSKHQAVVKALRLGIIR